MCKIAFLLSVVVSLEPISRGALILFVCIQHWYKDIIIQHGNLLWCHVVIVSYSINSTNDQVRSIGSCLLQTLLFWMHDICQEVNFFWYLTLLQSIILFLFSYLFKFLSHMIQNKLIKGFDCPKKKKDPCSTSPKKMAGMRLCISTSEVLTLAIPSLVPKLFFCTWRKKMVWSTACSKDHNCTSLQSDCFMWATSKHCNKWQPKRARQLKCCAED